MRCIALLPGEEDTLRKINGSVPLSFRSLHAPLVFEYRLGVRAVCCVGWGRMDPHPREFLALGRKQDTQGRSPLCTTFLNKAAVDASYGIEVHHVFLELLLT